MLTVLIWILGIYLAGIPLIYLWDAKFGWGDDPDTESTTPLEFGDLVLWPVLLVIIPFYLSEGWAEKVKSKRIQRSKEKEFVLL